MQVKIEKWGNSAAIKIPDEILNEIEASIGDVVEVNFESIEGKKKKYKLADLIAECNGELVVLEDWENMPSVGLEKI